MRIKPLGTILRRAALLAFVALAAGCGSTRDAATTSVAAGPVVHLRRQVHVRCDTHVVRPLRSSRRAYAAIATRGAVAYRRPGGAELARFGPRNVNDYPTVFGVLGVVVGPRCGPTWYRVQLPLHPNGITGFVRARTVTLERVRTRIVVSVARRQLTLYRDDRPLLRSTVAVGSPATPTPLGSFYVNQRLVPDDPNGPFGPGAVGISAFSTVLTGWAQGGPIAIHGTNEPWSIGHAASNGCIRLPNAVLRRLWPLAVAGTPVLVER